MTKIDLIKSYIYDNVNVLNKQVNIDSSEPQQAAIPLPEGPSNPETESEIWLK